MFPDDTSKADRGRSKSLRKSKRVRPGCCLRWTSELDNPRWPHICLQCLLRGPYEEPANTLPEPRAHERDYWLPVRNLN